MGQVASSGPRRGEREQHSGSNLDRNRSRAAQLCATPRSQESSGLVLNALRAALGRMRNSKFARDALQLLALNLAAKLLQFAGNVYAARCLGPVNLGVSAQVLAVVQQVSLAHNGGFDTVAVREIAGKHASAGALLATVTAFRLMVSSLLCIAWLAIASFANSDGLLKWPWFFGAALLIINSLSINYLFQGLERLPIQAAISVLGAVVMVGTYLCWFSPPMPVGSDLIVLTASAIASTAASWIYCARIGIAKAERSRWIEWRNLFPALRELLGKSWRYWLLAFVTYYYAAFQIPLIGYFRGDHEAGLYRSAFILASAIELLFNSINSLLLPRLVAWNQRGVSYLWERQRRLVTISLIVGAPPVAILICISDFVYETFLGDEFIGGARIFQILLVGRLIVFIGQIYAWGLAALNLDEQFLRASVLGAVASLGLGIVFIPSHGVDAAAIIAVMSEIVVCLSCYCFEKAFVQRRNRA